MKKLILTAAAAASLAMLSSAAQAQCMIYSEPNYQGAAGIVQPNDVVVFHDHNLKNNSHFRYFTDKSWFNNIRSSKTTGTCELGKNSQKGGLVVNEVRLKGDHPNHDSNMAAMVACYCN
jgi:hypothetical protein